MAKYSNSIEVKSENSLWLIFQKSQFFGILHITSQDFSFFLVFKASQDMHTDVYRSVCAHKQKREQIVYNVLQVYFLPDRRISSKSFYFMEV